MVELEHTLTVQSPSGRREIMYSLAALGDVDYQRRVWINQQFPSSQFYDDAYESIESLYDRCLPNAARAVGVYLLNADEASKLDSVGEALQKVLKDNQAVESAQIVLHTDWPIVVHRSQDALSTLVCNRFWMD